ncbi:MAG: NAD-dependent DNA ligase LigA [Planctomycetota bacterium]|nr:NAD-dependent DNA ligase LigA [Planctomycetota bacterium]
MSPKKTEDPRGSEHARRAETLRAEIRRHDLLYYNEGRAEISDAEYDALFRELKALEEEHPELAAVDSPTRRVGAPLPEGGSFEKVRHAVPMLSIESLRSEDEARDFAAKVHRFLGLAEDDELVWHVEPKFDGVSAALVYVDGVLSQGLTRGDGTVGEDITANLATIRDVPLRLDVEPAPPLVEVRGEVLIARERFERFNAWREANGYSILANARNATAGALRRNDPAEVQRYPLEFHAYAVVRAEGVALSDSHAERLRMLAEWGFSETVEDRTVTGIEGCLAYQAEMESRRDAIPFEMDGVVAKLDDVPLRDRLGANSRATKWQYAHKFAPVEATTVLRAIEIQVGVNGRLTPRAHVDPVEVLGVTVRHATLHNEDYVLTLGAAPGDRVFVKRAGDVIPQITGVAKKAEGEPPAGWDADVPDSLLRPASPEDGAGEADTDGSAPLRAGVVARFGEAFAMPATCPACGTEVVREGKYVRCPNVYGCGPQVVGRTVHMAGRSGFEIDSIGEKMIVQLFQAGHLDSPADLFALRSIPDEELVGIERWGQKTVDNLKAELDEKRRATLSKFLRSLSIPEVGGSTARLLAKNFASLEDVKGATVERLVEIDGIGEEVAGRIRSWFDGERNLQLIEALLESGVEIVIEEEGEGGGTAFDGAVVVFTGTLERMSRFEAKAAVEAQGGRVASSVSKKTTFLVVGGKPGSKAKKAEEIGVTVLLEEAFLAQLAGEEPPATSEGEHEGEVDAEADADPTSD